MSISRVAILGAGAVGASLAHQLLQAPNQTSLTVLARGERADRLRLDGFVVNGERIRADVADSGRFDLILVAVKSYHLEEALPLLDSCRGPDTAVMSLLNGILSESQLGERFGHECVVPAMILGIDAQREDGGIRYTNRGVIHFGANPQVPDQSALIGSLAAWFDAAGLSCTIADDITRTLWKKFMINVGANQVSAVLGAPYARLQTDSEARGMMRAAMEEVVRLSEAEGTGLTDSDIADWLVLLDTLDPSGKTSMLQDADAGRPMEIDLFAGTVVKLAAKHGLAVPVNRDLQDRLLRMSGG